MPSVGDKLHVILRMQHTEAADTLIEAACQSLGGDKLHAIRYEGETLNLPTILRR